MKKEPKPVDPAMLELKTTVSLKKAALSKLSKNMNSLRTEIKTADANLAKFPKEFPEEFGKFLGDKVRKVEDNIGTLATFVAAELIKKEASYFMF